MKKAVVLLSGGLDSATALAIAIEQGYACYSLSFDYGQKAIHELQAAETVARRSGVVAHKVVKLDLGSIGGSALTDGAIDIPEAETSGIPVTYVPARNTVFLSIALGYAEVLAADAIVIGVNAVDYSGYPDCRPEFIAAFQQLANVATKDGVEGHVIDISTPLMAMTKADIIRAGLALGVDYAATVSCYQAGLSGAACGKCDSCRLRLDGFRACDTSDPAAYI